MEIMHAAAVLSRSHPGTCYAIQIRTTLPPTVIVVQLLAESTRPPASVGTSRVETWLSQGKVPKTSKCTYRSSRRRRRMTWMSRAYRIAGQASR